MENGGAGWISYGVLALVLSAVLAALWQSGFLGRLTRLIEEMVLGNWQLAVLGATALALSLASGYTTFDGLRSFTAAPLLSALVTFGIQGVMLIVSWLIGETFATGMLQQAPRTNGTSADEAAPGPGTGLGLITLVLRYGGDIVQPYVQSVRLILKNAVLWVMLLATMGCSVFFSFDSHFSAIFPAGQRQRAAAIRTLNQVGGIVADIGERARQARAAEAGRLLESEAWQAYDEQLDTLAGAARSARAQMKAALVARVEARQSGIGEQRERIAAAERSRSALLGRRDELEAELQRLETSIGRLEAKLAKAQAAYDETRQAIAAKKIEASAEDGGVEGSGKRGKGPVWRRRMAELEALQRKLESADAPRLEAARRRRDAASARIVGLRRELATVNAEAAKYKGTIAAAGHRIAATREAGAGGEHIDPERMLEAFERARTAFRRRPEAARLAAVEVQCRGLKGALSGVPAARETLRGIDCSPDGVAEAAVRVLALNAGLEAFAAGCAGGSKLPQTAGTDALLAFGRKCLQDSGLASTQAAGLGSRLRAIEMNRDDRAHRFVVTWNAFLDGNRLGYLALALAIGVDALVFMAGLFGAAAARSPLSDLPGPAVRSAGELEAVVTNALGENRLENAELVLGAMRPAPGDDGLRSEVDLAGRDGERAERIRKVLVAGRSIGAVERAASDAPGEERYLVRPQLIEFLSTVANAARQSEPRRSDRARLARVVGMALEPDRPGNAALVLRHAEPVGPRRGVVARIDPAALAREKDRRIVQGVLAAGMSVGTVARQGAQGSLWHRALRRPDAAGTAYLISAELFETLLQYRADAAAKPPARREAEPVQLTATNALLAPTNNEVIDARAVESPPLLTDARTGLELPPQRDDEDLRRHFRDTLLSAVATEVKATAADIGRRSEAGAPRAALERMADGCLRAVQRATRTLEREHGNDQRALGLLYETRHEIAGNKSGLLLSLLEDLIGEAEREGNDGLLGALRRLRDLAAMETE